MIPDSKKLQIKPEDRGIQVFPLLHTCMEAKSPEAQAPRIAAPTKTDSTSWDRTIGLPVQERNTPLLGRMKYHSTQCTINNHSLKKKEGGWANLCMN